MRMICFAITLALALSLAACSGQESGPTGTTGWEHGSSFDTRYDVSEFDKIKGYFEDFEEVRPMEGMAPGLAIIVKDRTDGEPVSGIIGPASFVREEAEALNLRQGQKVKIYGSWAYIDGRDVLILTKIKKNEKEFVKVRRTKDGYPYWSLSEEELAEERAEQ